MGSNLCGCDLCKARRRCACPDCTKRLELAGDCNGVDPMTGHQLGAPC